MKKQLLAAPILALMLGACTYVPPTSSEVEGTGSGEVVSGESTSEEAPAVRDIDLLTPTGAPTLAFYDQGDNERWVSTSTATSIPASFATNDYDAIVFDGTNGLNVISRNSYSYKLAKWISGGNFYLVSTTHATGDAFTGNETIYSFNQTGNASRAFNKLAKDYWKWTYEDSQVTYADGVQQVAQTLIANPTAYDYYVIAEPVLTNARTQLAAKDITLNTVYNLQTEWKAAGYGESIPAAALFVNENSYEEKKDEIDAFIVDTTERIETAVNDAATVVETLLDYGTEDEIQARFGYRTAQVTALQGSGENRFGLLASGVDDAKAFADSFWTALGNQAFDESLFL